MSHNCSGEITRKFTLFLVLTVLVAILGFSLPARAQGVVVSLSAPVEIAVDRDFIATLDVTNLTDFDAGQFDILFDNTMLRLDDVTSGKIETTEIPVLGKKELTSGNFRVIVNVPEYPGVSGSGYLVKLHFHVIGSAGSSTTVNISNGYLNDNLGKAITATWNGDSATVYEPVVMATTTLNYGVVGISYTNLLQATGGNGSYVWSVSSGSLPNGINLSSAGEISGTPITAGTSTFTVAVTDGWLTDSKVYDIIAYNPLAVTTASLPDGVVGNTYSAALQVSGGNGSYTWSVLSGSLPEGLSLSSTGEIAGTPTTAGTFSFTTMATDSTLSDSKVYSLIVHNLLITTDFLPDGVAGDDYSALLRATGGNESYTWSVLSGSLPEGLSLSSTGEITGTLATVGDFGFTVEATDGTASYSKECNITVRNPGDTVVVAQKKVIAETSATLETMDEKIIINFPQGAVPGETLVSIKKESSSPPEVSSGFKAGSTYFTIEATTDNTAVTELGKEITITVKYSDEDVAAAGGDPSLLAIAYYDDDIGQWTDLITIVNTEQKTLTVTTDHLSRWMVLVKEADAGSSALPLILGLTIPGSALLGAGGYYLWRRRRNQQIVSQMFPSIKTNYKKDISQVPEISNKKQVMNTTSDNIEEIRTYDSKLQDEDTQSDEIPLDTLDEVEGIDTDSYSSQEVSSDETEGIINGDYEIKEVSNEEKQTDTLPPDTSDEVENSNINSYVSQEMSGDEMQEIIADDDTSNPINDSELKEPPTGNIELP